MLMADDFKFECKMKGCKRRFQTRDRLKNHYQRRHKELISYFAQQKDRKVMKITFQEDRLIENEKAKKEKAKAAKKREKKRQKLMRKIRKNPFETMEEVPEF